jgi:uncharacterized membrane protein (Fun14 family)
MSIENISSVGAAIGGGFFAGVLIGYALKKVVRIVAVVVGLFFAGLAYLQYQQILNINWPKLQATSQNVVTMFDNAITQISDHLSKVASGNNHTTAMTISNLDVPLTGSMAMGFAIGFMKG